MRLDSYIKKLNIIWILNKETTLSIPNQLLYRIVKVFGLIIIIFLFKTVCYGEDTMQPLYKLNRAVMAKLEPKVYSTKDKEILGLMDYPMDNAVATNRLNNAVTLIAFNNDRAKFKTVAKNFKDYVGGGLIKYLPVFSEDTIGYSQSRGFTKLNIKTKKCNYYSIAGSSNLLITGVTVIDAERSKFLFRIRFIASKERTQILRLMDLSTAEGTIIKEKIIVGNWGITVTKDAILLHDKTVVKAMDFDFNEMDHPLISIIRNNKSLITGGILEISFHPYLPFAIVHDQNHAAHQCNIWVSNWRESNKNKDPFFMTKLIKDCDSFKFTDDGKWVIFRDFDYYYMMPVDQELPNFLGPPILLGELPSYPDNVTAMTRNPTGLVVAKLIRKKGKDVSTLLKWDFSEAEKLLKKP